MNWQKEINETGGIVSARVSTFDKTNSNGDHFERGAFGAWLASSPFPIPMRNRHGKQVGWWFEGTEDSEGLTLKGAVNLDDEDGWETYRSIQRGDGGWSITYPERDFDYKADGGKAVHTATVSEASWTPSPSDKATKTLRYGAGAWDEQTAARVVLVKFVNAVLDLVLPTVDKRLDEHAEAADLKRRARLQMIQTARRVHDDLFTH